MNRNEAEKKIMQKLEEIRAIVEEYYPENDYLTLSILCDDNAGYSLSFNNSYWEKTCEKHLCNTFRHEIKTFDTWEHSVD